ncbi:YlmC/YmxH family sporulation protein [Filibacter tadaridae]|uniref:PRC-barrel domain protein n=1 Tax=Filibacter tadaridae TaxID=2483811 RepID=A0A3P5X5D2_9BACL|nr:YlmC/YmxH family sporulation protein [Filibacter tadaridae]VDC29703.1 PRC-barrel domain protein [Filibacter tadaridae]
MLLSELAQKELIQVEDGIRYGYLADTDLIFNGKTGDIVGFEIRKKFGRFSFRNRQEKSEEFIPWNEIVLIGEHRILFGKTVSMDELDEFD